MKKHRIITLALCAMLAVGSMTTLTACGGTVTVEERTADLQKYLDENQSYKEGYDAAALNGAEISDLYAENGYLAMDITLKSDIEFNDRTWKLMEQTFPSMRYSLMAALGDPVKQIADAVDYPDLQLRLHYFSKSGEQLYDVVISTKTAWLERIKKS